MKYLSKFTQKEMVERFMPYIEAWGINYSVEGHYGKIKGVRYFGGEDIEFELFGEKMLLKDGDMIVTPDGKEIYRITSQEFSETYLGEFYS